MYYLDDFNPGEYPDCKSDLADWAGLLISWVPVWLMTVSARDILVHNSWTVMLVLSVSSNWGRNSVLTETLLDKIQTRRKEQKLLWWSNIAGLIVTEVLLSFISLFLTWPVATGYQEVGGLSAGTRLTPRTPVSVHGCQGRPGLGSGQFQ